MRNNALLIVHSDGSKTAVDEIDGLVVDFRASDSVVEIGEGSRFRNAKISMGLGGIVRIGQTHRRGLNNTSIDLTGNGLGKILTIGKGTSIEGARFALGGGGPREVHLGEECLLSSGITFRPSDGHAIFDLESGEVINPAKPIVVGNHVWVSASVTFVKGSKVADHTIIGTQALVSRRFEEQYTAIAGNPAQVVKRGIGWDRAHVEDYQAAKGVH